MTRVAAVQMVAGGSAKNNRHRAAQLIQKAADTGARLVVLPEYFAYYGCTGTTFEEQIQAESRAANSTQLFLSEQAKKKNIWLLGGTLPVVEEGDHRPYAASLLFSPSGELAARYNKIHLFDASVGSGREGKQKIYRESDSYRPGDAVIVADTPFGRVGLSVCYDLRFPELYRAMVAQGAEILVVPAAFTKTTGEAHWQLLLRARAVENLCYVIGANMGDRDHPDKPTWGGSAIVDPWGDILASEDAGTGVVVADIDLHRLHDLRGKLTVLEHRRL